MLNTAGVARMTSKLMFSCGRASVGRLVRTADTGCYLEDLPRAMDDSDGWKEKVREICASSAIMMI